MIDTLFSSFTVFDAVFAVLIILSAIMSLARGFMRELATFGALFSAVIGSISVSYTHLTLPTKA